MSIRKVIQATAAGAAALPLLLTAGCMSTSGDVQGARLSDNFSVYAPFDNQRDWGPSYLVGAPAHHVGDDSRIDDTRSAPPNSGVSPADPKGPPLTEAPQSNNGSGPSSTPSVPPASPQPLP